MVNGKYIVISVIYLLCLNLISVHILVSLTLYLLYLKKKMLNCPNLQLPIVFFKVALFTHTL